MTFEKHEAAAIAKIALQYHKLSAEGVMYSGGPVNAETIKVVAGAVSDSLDVDQMLSGLAKSGNPARLLRSLLAISWAQGFNTGSMYAEGRDAPNSSG
ncbi:hypothetical protein [Embleya sp. NPDC005971]|uniref:hypothetical protein n=1 Tax=Embleya sp. NPDC005971 TaxID=3156724 RepID=UPI003405282B